jgi:hypothetical protein
MAASDWETVGVVEVDGGMVAFADRLHLPAAVAMVIDHEGWRPGGATVPRSLVAVGTGGDMPLPVEILRHASGTTVAARMAFVDDLDDLDGEWVEVGRLAIGDRGCIALDPSVPASRATRVQLELPSGTWLAEAFEWEDDGDVLALRLTREADEG